MTAPSGKPRIKWVVALPLLIFAGLAAALYFRLYAGDITRVPSPLVGRSAPAMQLPVLEGTAQNGIGQLDTAAFKGKVTVVNVWASWCVPCRDEHPQLMALAKRQDIELVGINYKDAPENALHFLKTLGNPFAVTGTDKAGRAAIEWGVYGVPETFIVNREGRIIYKHIGPLSDQGMREVFLPALEKALAE